MTYENNFENDKHCPTCRCDIKKTPTSELETKIAELEEKLQMLSEQVKPKERSTI